MLAPPCHSRTRPNEVIRRHAAPAPAACPSNPPGADMEGFMTMFSKITFAAAAQAYDAFGGGDHETVIRQSAQSPATPGMSQADARFTVGTNAWNGDRQALITRGARLGNDVMATNAR